MILDESRYSLFYKNKIIELTKNETKIMNYIIQNKDRYVTTRELCDLIYRELNEDNKNKTRKYIHRINKKIPQIYKILNKPWVGYKIGG